MNKLILLLLLSSPEQIQEYHLETIITSQCTVDARSIKDAEKKASKGCWERTDKKYKIWSIPKYTDPWPGQKHLDTAPEYSGEPADECLIVGDICFSSDVAK